MTTKDFNTLAETMWADCSTIMHSTKGVDYASLEDRLANFKDQAQQFGLEPLQVWLVYAGKHFDAIVRAIKKNPKSPTKRGEPLRENFKDIIVYAFLGNALVEEANEKEGLGKS